METSRGPEDLREPARQQHLNLLAFSARSIDEQEGEQTSCWPELATAGGRQIEGCSLSHWPVRRGRLPGGGTNGKRD